MYSLGTQFFIFFLVGAFAWYIIKVLWIDYKTKQLNKKFLSLGDLKGKRLSDIHFVVGPAKVREYMADGTFILTWTAGNYYISLHFDCAGYVIRILKEQY